MALEKKAAMKNAKPLTEKEKSKMYRNRYDVDEYLMTLDSVNVTRIAIIRADIEAVIIHENHCASGLTPRIDNVS